MIPAEDLIMHAHHHGRPVRIGGRDQLNPGGRAHVQIQVCDLRDQQRLSRIRYKTRSLQPPGQFGRLIVGVVLPLPRAPQLGEPADLGLNHRVGIRVHHVGPQHTVPAVSTRDNPGNPLLALDSGPGVRNRVTAHLVVKLQQHGSTVHGIMLEVRRRVAYPASATNPIMRST
jgi:hypothetical protein